jgi:hypothetical protein
VSGEQNIPKLERIFVWLEAGFRRISGDVIAKSGQFFRVAHNVIVFDLFVRAPGLRMPSQPGSAFISPLMQQRLWHGIRKAKCDEIGHAHLTPMREAPAEDSDFAMWIEASKGNMPTNIHREMIISVWPSFFNTRTMQTGLSASRTYFGSSAT